MMSKILVNESQLLGAVAKWGIRQSPYAFPENLLEVLDEFGSALKPDFIEEPLGFKEFESEDELLKYLHFKLVVIKPYLTWNDRKNGNDAPFGFTSRYDTGGDPDNDLIDLDALEQNVARELVLECENVPF